MIDDTITLEPRLQEYLKKKEYYQKNNIEVQVPLEMTYCITQDDTKRIKRFNRGKVDLYSRNRLNNESNFIDNTNNKKDKSDYKYKQDPRYKRLQNKLKKQRDATIQRNNYSNIYQNINYESKLIDEINDQMHLDNDNIEYEEKQINQFEDNSYLLSNNPYEDKKKYKNEMVYHEEPSISYNNRLYNTNVYDLNNNHNNSSFKKNKFNKKIINHINNFNSKIPYDKSCENNTNNQFELRNQIQDNQIRNIDLESYVTHGESSRNSKKMGYKNPVEHYYNYIDDSLQKPIHVLNDRGIPTREMNRKIFER